MQLSWIDAFTESPFKGNPAAVCLLDSFPDDRFMQALAYELQLSETAYLVPTEGGYRLRWFTPVMEVDLCGHATLASAHHLWETGEIDAKTTARFETRSGWLTATRKDRWIEMDFPAQPPIRCSPPAGMIEALGVRPGFVGRNDDDWLIAIESERQLRDLAPDLERLGEIDARGFIVTSISADDDFDFVSRFFAPAAGVDEDPVTGSAHCCLGPFWAGRLDKSELVGFQASERGGVVRVATAGDRVRLSGQAVTVLQAEVAVGWS